MVICQGCGQAFDVPEGYSRNKIQCPGCGVICPVPTRAAGKSAGAGKRAKAPAAAAPGPALEDEAAQWLKDDAPSPDEAPPRFEDPPPQQEANLEPVVRKPPEVLIPCRRCGRKIRKQRECPSCDNTLEGPLPEEPEAEKQVGLAPHSLELDEPGPAPLEEDEDDSPYVLAEKLPPTCPKCRKDMIPGAVLCTACGFNRRTRKKAGRSYEPLARSWETDMPLATRLMWLGAAQLAHVGLALLFAVSGRDAWPFVVSWPLLTGILCFVLGTYNRIDLTRDVRGRVKASIQWRFGFVPLMPQVTEVHGFEGVTTGQWHDAGFWEWFVLLSLLPLGVIPAIIWWYNAIHKQHFHVALARDHGYPEVYVYRGRSQEQMDDVAASLCNASGLGRIS